MIEVNISTAPCTEPKILIGRQCENDAVKIVFDLSYLIQTFGDGTAVLVHQRVRDDAPYAVTATRNGSNLEWSVSNTDNAYVGVGQAELRWTVGDALAKTIIYKTWVTKSITADLTIPSAYQSWYDAMIEYIDQLKVETDEELAQAVADAEMYAERAEQAASTAGYMYFYIDENGDLIYQRTANVDVNFYLSDGDLYVSEA